VDLTVPISRLDLPEFQCGEGSSVGGRSQPDTSAPGHPSAHVRAAQKTCSLLGVASSRSGQFCAVFTRAPDGMSSGVATITDIFFYKYIYHLEDKNPQGDPNQKTKRCQK
jgi:hypothetical protein